MLMHNDKPAKILGVKIDKHTKTTCYLVEWRQRPNGYKPVNSYVRREDIPTESCQLVANFFERQLINKMTA